MRKFFSSLKESLKEDKRKEDGRSPHSHSPQAGASPAPGASVDELANSMGGMTLGGKPSRSSIQPQDDFVFVGGFQLRPSSGSNTPPAFPTPANYGTSSYTPAPLPSPPRICMPQPNKSPSRTMAYALAPPAEPSSLPAPRTSLTMQYALSDDTAYLELDDTPFMPPRSKSDEPRAHLTHSSESSSARFPASTGNLTPPRAQIQRAESEPPADSPSPSRKHDLGAVQCSAKTKEGKPCKRMVKSGPAVDYADPDADLKRYCHQHMQSFMSEKEFRDSSGNWVQFADWIPAYLSEETQAAIRVQMKEGPSPFDKPGYMYTFEIRDADSPVIELKTGRTSKVNRRLIEWKGQCRTNDLILRGFWPDDSSGSSGAASSLAIVDIDAGPPGPCMQIVERLVHLELADLVLHSHYLDPGFPDASKMTLNSESSGSDSGGDVSAKKGGNKSTKGATALKQLQRMSEPCIDCNKKHKEIFRFIRPEYGPIKNAEYEKIVRPVVAKWGRYVATHVAPPST